MTATTLEPRPVPIDIDTHQADQARRKAERAAKREELLKCCNPAYAARKEIAKPMYEFTVSAEWLANETGSGIAKVVAPAMKVYAQTEADAWAAACDRWGRYPSGRDANPVIKRGKALSAEQKAAALATGESDEAGGGELPIVRLEPKRRK